MRRLRDFVFSLTRHPLSLAGAALAGVSALLIFTLLLIEIFGQEGHAYLGIITYMILPAIFVLGLALIPWGLARQRRQAAASGQLETAFPVVDLNRPQTRNWLLTGLIVTAAVIMMLTVVTFKGVEYMESNSFCGETCHSVMAPEFTAFQRSPHARVHCVECHVGPGTSWFVKAKLSGAWQVVSVFLDLYPRPIPTPVHNLRPSNATCEQCHWPSKFYGARPKMITHFESNEANTELKTILMLKVGGHDFQSTHGIHWHMDPDIRIRYRSDLDRETVYEVELTDEDGTVKTYRSNDEPAGAIEWRTMDCVDCHNRPTHIYYEADEAVDLALLRGWIPRELPFLRREAVRAIQGDYASEAEAEAGIARALAEFYQSHYPETAAAREADIAEIATTLAGIWASNVFPAMNIEWGTYPDHLGHLDDGGCFRCHNGRHETLEGEEINSDCEICHTIVAWDEASPEILKLIDP